MRSREKVDLRASPVLITETHSSLTGPFITVPLYPLSLFIIPSAAHARELQLSPACPFGLSFLISALLAVVIPDFAPSPVSAPFLLKSSALKGTRGGRNPETF